MTNQPSSRLRRNGNGCLVEQQGPKRRLIRIISSMMRLGRQAPNVLPTDNRNLLNFGTHSSKATQTDDVVIPLGR